MPTAAAPRPARSVPQRKPALRSLLLATDLTESSDGATERAIELAALLHASLLVTCILDPARRPEGVRVDQLRDRAEAGLQAIVEHAHTRGVHATPMVWEGDVAETIVALAEAERVDMAVVGTHRLDGLRRFLIGSVSDHVIRHAPCPVLVVPPQRHAPLPEGRER